MRALWVLAAGSICALSALVAAVWVAASIGGGESGTLRLAHQVLSQDALATRGMLDMVCARDVQVERLLLELAAGGPAAEAARLEPLLARDLGGRVDLYLARGEQLSPLGGGARRQLSALRKAARRRMVEDETLPSFIDACQRQQTGAALWVVRSIGARALLEAAELSPDAIAFTSSGAEGTSATGGPAFPSLLGGELRMYGRERAASKAVWLLPALACACGAFLLGAVLALWFWKRAEVEETVLSTLELAAERVAQGDLSSTIQLRVGGRADQTFRSFDRMTAELRETRAKLAEAERAAAWQDMARRVAHEIKNPLSPIKMGLATLRTARTKQLSTFDEIFEESTHAMLEEVQRIEHIVREFSEFARLPKARPGALDLAQLIEEMARLYAPEDVAVGLSLPGAVLAHADREQMSQVIVNLLANAIDAARERDRPRVEISVTRELSEVVLRVDDSGAGVKQADRARIFEPYVTGKGHGTGLGLAIVRRIVQDHGGSVEVHDGPLGGARFEVRLPQSVSMP